MKLFGTISGRLLVLLSLLMATSALLLAPILSRDVGQSYAAAPASNRTLLLVPNRDRLAICVQTTGDSGVTLEAARSAVDAMLPVVAQHRSWSAAGLDVAPPVVASGCPGEPFLLQPGAKMAGAKEVGGTVSRVTTASPYRVFLYILPQTQIGTIFGDSASRVAAQEMLCEGQYCGEVTTGLYLSPGELRDPALLRTHLERAVGLEPRVVQRETGTQR